MGGLDHDDAERSARDQPVAPGKLAGARLVASGISEIAGPLGRDDRRQQLLVFGRIDPVMAAGQHPTVPLTILARWAA
jgi:hypothetical protein